MARRKIPAVANLRTSSPTNASIGKDSDKRQRAAVMGFAAGNGYEIVAEFYDVVSGADPIGERAGFKAMLDRIAGNGVRTIIVESPDRFARDLVVQLAGHDYLRSLGVELVPASAPDFFLADTPTAVLVRQVLGAISQFEKASLVAKLRGARDRSDRFCADHGGTYFNSGHQATQSVTFPVVQNSRFSHQNQSLDHCAFLVQKSGAESSP